MLPRFSVLLCVILTATSFTAHAHLMHKQEATLRLDGDKAYLVVAVPATAFSGVDNNADGMFSPEEIAAHRDEISRQFIAGFQVASPDGPAAMEFAWVTNPSEAAASTDPHALTSYVIIMAGAKFVSPPTTVTVRTELFGSAPDEKALKLRARNGDNVEAGVLQKHAPERTFFADVN